MKLTVENPSLAIAGEGINNPNPEVLAPLTALKKLLDEAKDDIDLTRSKETDGEEGKI